MLNRRHLRIKALQSLYAFISSGDNNVEQGEKELLKSILASKELIVWQLSIINELHFLDMKILDEAKQKFLPTYEDLHPNMRFANNRLVNKLYDNRNLNNLIQTYHVSWIENYEVIRRIYGDMKKSEAYLQYLDSPDTFDNDKKFVISIFINHIFPDETIMDLFETKSIFWHNDFLMTQYVLVKFLEEYSEDANESYMIPDMLKIGDNDTIEDDKTFVLELFRKTLYGREHFFELIKSKLKNWDADRVSTIDIIIMEMALCEFTCFPTIPVKVTLNEYIELSKTFSGQTSKLFINGILDNLVEHLKASGEINKVGRGLM